MMCFGRGLPVAGFMLLCWATIAFVVAALTTWWILLALIPMAMMASGMAMMGTMARSAGKDGSAWPWRWCGMGSTFADTDHEANH